MANNEEGVSRREGQASPDDHDRGGAPAVPVSRDAGPQHLFPGSLSRVGDGVLIVWTDIPAKEEEDFNDWYNREYVADRVLSVPGFKRGRRFAALSGGPRYIALYEADSPQVYADPRFLALVENPDQRSRHFIPQFRNTIRVIGRVSCSIETAEGGICGFLGLDFQPGGRDEFVAWANAILFPRLLQRRGVVAVRLWELDEAALAESRRRHLRQGDREFEAMLMIEATDESELERARVALLRADRLLGRGVRIEHAFTPARFIYRLAP